MANNASGIKAGRAYVELGVSDKLTAGLNAAQRQMAAFGAQIQKIGLGLTAAGAATTAPFIAAARVFADTGSALNDLSGRTGLSIEALSSLSFAAKQTGASTEDLEGGLRKMQALITKAGQGSKEAAEKLARLGLSAVDLVNASPEAALKLIADRLSAVVNPSARAATAIALFGKSGTKLLPLMAEGARGIEAFQKQAEDAGIVMSTSAAQSADALGDAYDKLNAAAKASAVAIGGQLAPELTGTLNAATNAASAAIKFAQAHGDLVKGVATGGAIFAGLGTVLTAVGVAAAFVSGPVLGVAAALAAVIGVAVGTSSTLNKLTEATRQATDAGDRMRATDLDRMRRLETLSNKHRKSAAELAEQRTLVEQLRGRYGSFGAEIDSVTGRVNVAADAFDRLSKSITASAAKDLEAELASLDTQAKELSETIRGRGGPLTSGKGGLSASILTEAFGSSALIKRDLETLNSAIDKRTEIAKRLKALRGGDLGAATNSPQIPQIAATPVATGLSEKEKRAIQQAALERIRSESDIQDLRIKGMAEGLDKEVALVKNRYDTEIKLARKVGDEQKAQFLTFEKGISLAQAFQAEQDRIAAKQQDAADFNQRSADDLERARIEAGPDGVQKSLALNELEQQRAIREALNSEFVNQIDFDLIAEKFSIIAEQIQKAAEPMSKASTTGTFSSFALDGLGLVDPAQRTARAAEELLRIARRSGGLVFGP